MREEHRKRLALFFLGVGVGFALIAVIFYFRVIFFERILTLLRLRRAPSWWA